MFRRIWYRESKCFGRVYVSGVRPDDCVNMGEGKRITAVGIDATMLTACTIMLEHIIKLYGRTNL